MAGEADELQGVAVALFGNQQQGLPRCRPAIPARPPEIGVNAGDAFLAGAPFVFGKTLAPVTQRQAGEAEVEMRRRMVPVYGQGLAEAEFGVGQLAQVEQHGAAGVPGGGRVAVGLQRLFAGGERLR